MNLITIEKLQQLLNKNMSLNLKRVDKVLLEDFTYNKIDDLILLVENPSNFDNVDVLLNPFEGLRIVGLKDKEEVVLIFSDEVVNYKDGLLDLSMIERRFNFFKHRSSIKI